eukprot:scaffold3134_cov155-Skeletonema_marinoi.AAC.5
MCPKTPVGPAGRVVHRRRLDCRDRLLIADGRIPIVPILPTVVFLQTRPSEILRPLLHCAAHPKNPLQQFGLACTKAFAIHLRRPTRTQQAPQASSGTARAPPGLSSPFSTDPRV